MTRGAIVKGIIALVGAAGGVADLLRDEPEESVTVSPCDDDLIHAVVHGRHVWRIYPVGRSQIRVHLQLEGRAVGRP